MKKISAILLGIFLVLLTLQILGCEQQTQTRPNVPIAQNINFVGSSSTYIYHLPTCKDRPHDADAVFFDSPLAAKIAGFKPCPKCKPPTD